MNSIRHALSALVFSVLLATVAGSGGCNNPSTGKPPDTRTPAEYFKERQAATMTPNGKIKTDTVKEKDGKIEYETEDGKKWSVGYSKRADGTYQYETPDETK